MRLLLAGEGRNELGGWFGEPEYRAENPDAGVLQALLHRVETEGWTVVDAIQWKQIRKYKAGGGGRGERRNVKGVWLKAKEKGCDAVVFSRDRDADADRQRQVEETIRGLADEGGPAIIGGMAIEKLEAWILALRGEHGSERHRYPDQITTKQGIETTEQMVSVIDEADLDRIPPDAASLRAWVALARRILAHAEW